MSKFVIELNSRGVRELLRSDEMLKVCEGHAADMAKRLGGAYAVSLYRGVNRVNASVYTEDPDAIRENLSGNTMLKAMGGSRK